MLSCTARAFRSRIILNGCRSLPRGSHDDSWKGYRSERRIGEVRNRAVWGPVKEGQVGLEKPNHNCRQSKAITKWRSL
jgi:hypothetical protein